MCTPESVSNRGKLVVTSLFARRAKCVHKISQAVSKELVCFDSFAHTFKPLFVAKMEQIFCPDDRKDGILKIRYVNFTSKACEMRFNVHHAAVRGCDTAQKGTLTARKGRSAQSRKYTNACDCSTIRGMTTDISDKLLEGKNSLEWWRE